MPTSSTAPGDASARPAGHVLVVAWEPEPLPRVPAWPRVAAIAAALHQGGVDVQVLADPATLGRVDDRLPQALQRHPAELAAPMLAADLRTTATNGGLALQTTGADAVAGATSIHAVGWSCAYGAVALADTHDLPLVVTPLRLPRVDDDPDTRWVHDVRRWLCTSADRLVTPSRRLAERLRSVYGLDTDSVVVPLPRSTEDPPDLDALAPRLTEVHRIVRRRNRPPRSRPSARHT